MYVRKHRVLVKHLVFSFHFYAFALVVLAAMGVLLSPIAFALSSPLKQSETQVYVPWVDRALTMVLGAVLIYYLYRIDQGRLLERQSSFISLSLGLCSSHV